MPIICYVLPISVQGSHNCTIQKFQLAMTELFADKQRKIPAVQDRDFDLL